jgi:hypothetical protein
MEVSKEVEVLAVMLVEVVVELYGAVGFVSTDQDIHVLHQFLCYQVEQLLLPEQLTRKSLE